MRATGAFCIPHENDTDDDFPIALPISKDILKIFEKQIIIFYIF